MTMFTGSLEITCPWCKQENIEIHRIDFPTIASGGNTVGWHCVHNCAGEYVFFEREVDCPWCKKPESIYVTLAPGIHDGFEITILGWHAIHFCHDHNRIKAKNSSFANKKIIEMYDEANREKKGETMKDLDIPIFTEEQIAESIHKYCLECAGQDFEVKACKAYTCPLYQFRMGHKEKPCKKITKTEQKAKSNLSPGKNLQNKSQKASINTALNAQAKILK